MAAAIPFIMLAATVASTAAGVFSTISAGNAEEDAADRAAEQSRAAASREAADTEKQHRRIIATQEARYGASGLTMEGSPLLVQQESLRESKEQLRRIMEGGENVAYAYEEKGNQAATSGYVGGIKSLLGGASSVGKIVQSNPNSFNWW
jgi:hypothetical protein